ncbi:hypothetical protein E2C01_014414 [Portunus trituberculatus]|uniref:Uncharacterized protein n=1 Tax=Portunus trituberculatus TaxID=210409 RepID=A0A5B7DJ54_PORTR|nr:hypothetical protein [Portunus trituberculatus]
MQHHSTPYRGILDTTICLSIQSPCAPPRPSNPRPATPQQKVSGLIFGPLSNVSQVFPDDLKTRIVEEGVGAVVCLRPGGEVLRSDWSGHRFAQTPIVYSGIGKVNEVQQV